jgi:hypothetical protein
MALAIGHPMNKPLLPSGRDYAAFSATFYLQNGCRIVIGVEMDGEK